MPDAATNPVAPPGDLPGLLWASFKATVLREGLGHLLLSAALLLLVCLVLGKLLLWLLKFLFRRFSVDPIMHGFLLSLTRFGLVCITVVLVALSLGVPPSALVALISVVGLAVSLSIQGALSNLAGGLVLLATKPFRVDDYIEAAGVSGTVVNIGLVYTTLNTPDNKVVLMPNSELSSVKIINYSGNANRRVDLYFNAALETPVEQARQAILAAVDRLENVVYDPEPFVGVSSFGEQYVQYILRVWVNNAQYRTATFSLLETVKEVFDERAIRMTFNHLQLHIGVPPDPSS